MAGWIIIYKYAELMIMLLDSRMTLESQREGRERDVVVLFSHSFPKCSPDFSIGILVDFSPMRLHCFKTDLASNLPPLGLRSPSKSPSSPSSVGRPFWLLQEPRATWVSKPVPRLSL